MKIAIFTDAFLPKIDGISISIDHLVRILGARGHEFIIFCPRYGENDFYQIDDHTEIIRFRNFPLPSYPDVKVVLPNRKKIKKTMKEFAPDIVHIHTPGLIGKYGTKLAVKYGVPMVSTYHTLVTEMAMYISPYRLLKVDRLFNLMKSKKKISRNLDKVVRTRKRALRKKFIKKVVNSMYEKADVIVSPSHLIEKTLREQKIKAPIAVISNGMDLHNFKGVEKKEISSPPRLLHVGRISFEKNVEILLRALKKIHQEFPGTTLDIIGDGPAISSLKIETRQLQLEDYVSFLGYWPHENLPEVYPKYDLFITASTMETQGLVVLEAIASGLPVVGVDSYALPELIHHEKNGFIAPPFDAVKIAEYSVAILKNESLARKFSQASIEIASHHDLDYTTSLMEDLYKKISAKKRKDFLDEPE